MTLIAQPSRSVLQRLIYIISSALPLLSIWQVIFRARELEVDVWTRPSWMGLIIILFILGCVPLLIWIFTRSFSEEDYPAYTGFLQRMPLSGWVLTFTSTIGFTLVFLHPFVRQVFGGEEWIRLLVFWYFTLIGTAGLTILRPGAEKFSLLITVLLIQTVFHLLVVQFSIVTNYPFSIGWSETTRFYQASLFLSKSVYGQHYPFPFINTTLEMLLTPPYLINSQLWIHRLWQVLVRVLFLALTSYLAVKRVVLERSIRGGVFLWVFLYIFMGPLYFHLSVSVILILYGYSDSHQRRSGLFLLVASIWAGWSRVNWYPVPAALMIILYLLEVPFDGKRIAHYLWRPILWTITGGGVAYFSQQLYVIISQVPPANFSTSFSSNLLWYRLWPNATYSWGLLIAAVLTSLPTWLMIFYSLKNNKEIQPLRSWLIITALLLFFLGGMAVSLKIGGGADLHNMDAYFVLMLIFSLYLVFKKYIPDNNRTDGVSPLPWSLVLLLLIAPIWSQLRQDVNLKKYDPAKTQNVLSDLQEYVDDANRINKEILFISQRHLISIGMLEHVTLVPEYEREDLMEMAMGGNTAYLDRFRLDMETQRFDAIIVDPLNYSIYSRRRSFSDENNIWVSEVMRYILCNYQLDVSYKDDSIAVYIPQEGERQCPK